LDIYQKLRDSMTVTLIFDSQCPLCVHEILILARRDHERRLDLVDLHGLRFEMEFQEISKINAHARLHARDSDGNWHFGLDATMLAWRAVGLGGWIAPLRWPVLRIFADAGYFLFARYRHRLVRLLRLDSTVDCERCILLVDDMREKHHEQ